MWALGILLYELVHNKEPFKIPKTKTSKPDTNAILKGDIKFKPGLSDQYKDLVKRLLQRNPEKRIALIKVFVHPWVKKIAAVENIQDELVDSDDSNSFISMSESNADGTPTPTPGHTPGIRESEFSMPESDKSIEIQVPLEKATKQNLLKSQPGFS